MANLISDWLTPGKRTFLFGTLLLTFSGFLCRFLGFFYRIFMSRAIGAEGLGLYSLMHPVFGICFAVCAGSIQTAVSQLTAANRSRGPAVLRSALLISLFLAGLSAWLITSRADFLARTILLEPRCAPYLPVIAVSVPFAALHACINGYYYGMKKNCVPALSQIAEQVIRMGAVFLIADIWLTAGRPVTVRLAVYGHLIGELASAAFTAVCLGAWPPRGREEDEAAAPRGGVNTGPAAAALLSLSLPLMGSRLVLNLLGSAEAIWIPNRLIASGLTSSEALSVYGVLTSMALPFVLFPSAVTNSVAVLLLPSVAEAQAGGNRARIASMVSLSLRYSCYMGILCIGVFSLFGRDLGLGVFHDARAGLFITVLCWLCPFLYLATTMGSILNGLGHTSVTFIQNTAAMIIRLFFVLLAIPRLGIQGYLLGLLASELALALMSLYSVRRLIPFHWDAAAMLLKPILLLLTAAGLLFALSPALAFLSTLSPFLSAAVRSALLALFYMALLLLLHRRS